MIFQKPKGTRDFFPEDMGPRNKVFASIKSVAERYGFLQVETPAFENLNLLSAKGGEEVSKQIFTLDKRGDEKFGLRFDLTVPVTRMFIERQKEIPKPVGWYYLTRMWRYEAPQKGRLREFYQFGVELFGSDKPAADAEVISLAIDVLQELGLKSNDFVIKINNRKLLQGLLFGLGIKKDIESVIRVIDKVRKISPKEFEDELFLLKLSKEQVDGVINIMNIKGLDDINEDNINDEALAGLYELKAVLDLLKSKEKFLDVDLSIARGLAYYTGCVFEAKDRKESFRSILGGGRYDNMVEQFGGSPEPATGFAMGDVVLELFLRDKKLWPESKPEIDFFVVLIGDVLKDALPIISDLRKRFVVDFDLNQRSFKKQLDFAKKIGAKKVIFLGPNEIKSKVLSVKDQVSGKEEKVKLSDLL